MTQSSDLTPEHWPGSLSISSITKDREWVCEAIQKINADYNRSSDTHLIRVEVPGFTQQMLYLKDESTHPTGSLKHRLARSLFLYGLCNGHIRKDRPIIESSSGSTAISEAYFARLLGLRFIAVIPDTTALSKRRLIEYYGGECHTVKGDSIYSAAQHLAEKLNGHYMDQFTYAERATDWRGNNNIAESIFQQMRLESHPVPDWVVMSAGTGGTSATIGRYLHLHPAYYQQTRLCVVDPENSVFFDYFNQKDAGLRITTASRIEGIGRPRVEASFQPGVIDRMLKIPDAASLACIHWLQPLLGRRCGGSTGTNVFGALQLMAEMRAQEQPGSVVSLICDSGDRYQDTYYNGDWLEQQGLELGPWLRYLDDLTIAT